MLLRKANKKIADLKEELQKKDSLLSSFMEVASGQAKRIASLTAEVVSGKAKGIASRTAAIQDTALWDPSTCPRPSSCSTPNHRSSWAEVVVHGRRGDSEAKATSPPPLCLSNLLLLQRRPVLLQERHLPTLQPSHH